MNHSEPIGSLLSQKGREVFSISPVTSVYDALAMMATKEIGALLVMQEGRLVGLVSERDYARKVILQGRSSKDTTVAEIMTSDLVTVTPSHSVDECMKLMTENRIRHLPVIDAERVVGVVSIGDLIKSIISAQEQEIQHLHAYIAGTYTA